ncbi:MAG TPA: ABC transporter permease [Spirochaetia bacterium]|jgi:simple sugar transport system permease protein|nr:ABC transporter permease [Spirochaetia bacterium]
MIDFISNLLIATVRLSTPITLAAIGATICERSGVVNIAMEGIMIVGAFFATLVTFVTGSPWLGILGGVISGGLFSLIHAVATVSLHLDHTVSGAVLNILAFGIARYFMVMVFGHPGTTDPIPHSLVEYQYAIPLLSKIPLIGEALFNQTPIVYMSFILVILFSLFLNRTKTGLHIRAAGEHPLALETIGVSVYRMRYLGVLISGFASGLAGAYLSIENNVSFTEGMTNGKGFIALAAMISGGWTPVGAFLASLFFGFADALQVRFQVMKLVQVPSELFIIFPYVATVAAVAGFVRKSRAPKADGVDFMIEKEGD